MRRGIGWAALTAIIAIFLFIVFNQLDSVVQSLSSTYGNKKIAASSNLDSGFDFSLDTKDWSVIWHDEIQTGSFNPDLWNIKKDAVVSKYSLLYGKVEIRARLAKESESLPCFWLAEDTDSSFPRIDVLHMVDLSVVSGDFHTFGVEWDHENIMWFVDGKKRLISAKDIPHERLILSLTAFPHDLEIEYVRVYKKAF